MIKVRCGRSEMFPNLREFWWILRNPVLSRVCWLSDDCFCVHSVPPKQPSFCALECTAFPAGLWALWLVAAQLPGPREEWMAAVTLVHLQPAWDILDSVVPASLPAGGWPRRATSGWRGCWRVAIDKVWTWEFCSWSCLATVLTKLDMWLLSYNH